MLNKLNIDRYIVIFIYNETVNRKITLKYFFIKITYISLILDVINNIRRRFYLQSSFCQVV